MCLKYCEEVLTSGITSVYYRDFIELVYYALSKKRQKSIQLIRKIIATCPNKELRYQILDALMDYYNEKSAEVSYGFIHGRNRHYFLPSY